MSSREVTVTPEVRALHFKYTGMYSSDYDIASWYKSYIKNGFRPYKEEKDK